MIETDRLLLREILEEDQETMIAYSRHPEVSRYLLHGQATEAYVRRWVADVQVVAQRRPRSFFGQAVVLKQSDQMIGMVTLALVPPFRRSARIGWEFDPHHWGQGYATEALRALVSFGFAEEHVGRITADCFAANLASIRIMQKLGMRRQSGILTLPWMLALRYRERQPIVRHRLTAEEWRSSQPQQN